MKPEEIRCQNDLQLYNTLLKHRDVIKVNEMIARQEEKGPTGLRRHLLATSVSLSKGMGISTIAEGVETEEELRFVLSQGCNEVQGYWSSAPVLYMPLKGVSKG